ncbi:MAG: hypothetical protein LBU15_01380 [Rickettsiales bacterium]|jgi:hypothetical protein|nr:hypothetical protein [Rickettsiales bacterium]
MLGVDDSDRILSELLVPKNLKERRKFPSRAKNKKKEQFDSVVVTTYDVAEAGKIFAKIGSGGRKSGVSGRSAYEETLKKANIARRNRISLTSLEKVELWRSFSKAFGILGDRDRFCREIGVSDQFLQSFMEDWLLWQKHLDKNLRRAAISDLGENIISDQLECRGIGILKKKYDLTELAMGYSSVEEKREARKRLDGLWKRLTSGDGEFSAAELGPVRVTKLNSIFKDDLSERIGNSLRGLREGEATRPLCIGDARGSCLMLRVDREESRREEVDEQTKLVVTSAIFGELLENKTKEALGDYSALAMVVHRH